MHRQRAMHTSIIHVCMCHATTFVPCISKSCRHDLLICHIKRIHVCHMRRRIHVCHMMRQAWLHDALAHVSIADNMLCSWQDDVTLCMMMWHCILLLISAVQRRRRTVSSSSYLLCMYPPPHICCAALLVAGRPLLRLEFRDLDRTRSLERVLVESFLFGTCSRPNNFYVYRSINFSVTSPQQISRFWIIGTNNEVCKIHWCK